MDEFLALPISEAPEVFSAAGVPDVLQDFCGRARDLKHEMTHDIPHQTDIDQVDRIECRVPYAQDLAVILPLEIMKHMQSATGKEAFLGIGGIPPVQRRVQHYAQTLVLGLQQKLYMGNIDAKRDWGHARDYIEAMYLILQQPKADDYVIATGVTTSVRDFMVRSFAHVGITLGFKGRGVNEVGFVEKVQPVVEECKLQPGDEVMAIDPRYFRPTEVDLLHGDPTKSKTILGWKPKYDVDQLLTEMVDADLDLMRRESHLKQGGFRVFNYHE